MLYGTQAHHEAKTLFGTLSHAHASILASSSVAQLQLKFY